MNAKFLNPSNYFGAPELALGPTFKIVGIKLEDVENDKGKSQRKGSITLEGIEKPWLSNVTNTKCLVAMFGDETDRWIGKRVTLHEERVMSFGEYVPGVRVSGSPDITAPVSVSIKLRKKKAQTITMQVTGTATPRPTPPGPVAPRVAMWNLWKSSGQTDGKAFWALVRTATGKGDEKQLTAADVPLFEAAMRRSPDDDPPPPPPPLSDDEQREILAREAALSNGAGA